MHSLFFTYSYLIPLSSSAILLPYTPLIEKMYIVLPYIKNIQRGTNFQALVRKLSFLPTVSDIFDIRQHYVRILFIFQRLSFIISNNETNMNLAVSGNGLAVAMKS